MKLATAFAIMVIGAWISIAAIIYFAEHIEQVECRPITKAKP